MRWQISIRYLLTHKRQTIICIVGVMIGVTMFIAMSAMMLGFREKFIIETVESSGHITVNDEPREASTPMLERAYRDQPNAVLELIDTKPREQVKRIKNPRSLIAKLRQMPGIVAVAPEVTGEAVMSYGTKTWNVNIVGIQPEEQLRVTTIGSKLLEGDFTKLRATADGVVIGNGVSIALGAGMGDTITITSPTGGKTTARVVGIYQTGVTMVDRVRVYMLINDAQTLLDKRNVVNAMTIRTDNYELAREYAGQIESICGYKTESWQEANENLLQIFVIQDMITYIITGSLLVVAAFGVLNILIMAVMERVNDIAILKSFGYSRGDITAIFMVQGLLIGLIGSLLGLAAAKGLTWGLARIPIQMEGMIKAEGLLMSETPSMYVTAFIFAMIVVMIAAVYPASRAAKFDPVDVIRGAH